MKEVLRLNEAFISFTRASRSLETYYTQLKKRVTYLTDELEKKNMMLNQAVDEIRESREYLQGIIQSIGEGIIVTDRNERISMMNNAARMIVGMEKENVEGLLLSDLRVCVEENISGTQLVVNGRRMDVIMSRSEVRDSVGGTSGYVIMIKDITRLRELERQNERNQRLVAMGEMAAKIVHEIRSPLCSIELFSNMLSDDLRGTEHSEMARGISGGIKSLNNILTNMLFFARPHKPVLKNIDMAKVIGESVSMLKPLMESRGIKLLSSYDSCMINGDSELLKQVLINILMNAIQAMPDGGNLLIGTGLENEHAVVEVHDEGEGISEENIEKIFDPFFSTKDKGTGLGLAIAHRIMQSHDGFIRACNNETGGSTFSLYFPLKHKMENHG